MNGTRCRREWNIRKISDEIRDKERLGRRSFFMRKTHIEIYVSTNK